MSNPNFFENIQYDKDPFWVVKEFLNTLDDWLFYKRLTFLVNSQGQSTEFAGCIFQNDSKDEDEEVYDGVFCFYFDDNVVVSEKYFRELLKIACERYLTIYPNSDDKVAIEAIIQKM